MTGWDLVLTYRGFAGEKSRRQVEELARELVQRAGAGWCVTIVEDPDDVVDAYAIANTGPVWFMRADGDRMKISEQ